MFRISHVAAIAAAVALALIAANMQADGPLASAAPVASAAHQG